MAKKHNKKDTKKERLLSQRAAQLQPVPHTLQPSAPPRNSAPAASGTQTTVATVAVSSRCSPSVPPEALAIQQHHSTDSLRGRSQTRPPASPHRSSTVSSNSETSFSPPPMPKRKQAREVSGLSDKQIVERYGKIRKTLHSMASSNTTRK